MGRVALVLTSDRTDDETGHGVDVKVDPGGGDTTYVDHFADVGDDSQPLPGDYAALNDTSGTGGEQASGYADTRNAGKALPGEKRIYARKPDGSVACDVWLKGDETIAITFGGGGAITCKENGDVVINGVVISALGKVTAPLDVVANAKVIANAVSLAHHVHPTAATGPASPPQVPGPV